MKRRSFHSSLAALPLASAWGALAQSKRPLRVAWVSTERKDLPSRNFASFRAGMSGLGYVEGRDLIIDVWWGEGSRDQVEKLVPEMLRAQPDVVLDSGGLALGGLMRAGVTLPIVFSVSADPMEAKLVQSFARPGGMLTGVSLFTLALVGKRLEILKEILPAARRVALIANPQHPGESQELDAARAAAAKLGLTVRYFPVRNEAELELAFADIAKQRDDAILAFADGFTLGFAARIAAFSLQYKIPAIDGCAQFAQQGKLLIYGPVIQEAHRPPPGRLCRQDRQGRQVRRSAGGTAHQGRAGRQPEDRPGHRADAAPGCACAGRGGHRMIDRRRFIDALTSVAAVAPVAASAQPASRMYRIGYIQTATAEEQEHLTRALEEALRARGYVEGRNVVFERRFADGRQERLPELAAELVRLNVDVIVTGGNPVIFAVKRATGTIPVVMAASRDPVGSGFIASLAAPGGNITGVTSDAASGIVGKHLQILKEVLPRASRMAVLWNPDPPGAVNYRREVESAARILGVQLQVVEARARNQFDGAFDAMARERCDAVVVQADPLFFTARRQIVDLAARHRLPAIYHAREVVELGGLMSYGVSLASQFRRAAVYVGKILEGAKPGDLPVEQPTTFELVINLKTGKSLGIAIPQNLLLRADEIIE